MRILIVGFFAIDYLVSLANAIANTDSVILVTTRQLLRNWFPTDSEPEKVLRQLKVIRSTVSLQIIDYPKGKYLQKLTIPHALICNVNNNSADVIHIQSGGDPWIPLALPWLRKTPLVITIHDASSHTGDGPPHLVLSLINRWMTRLAGQVIVHGRQQADFLINTTGIPKEKVHIIPLGPSGILNLLPNNFERKKNVVLFFGRLRDYKGIEVLIRAAPLIAAQIPDLRIVIAGSGDYPAVHQAAAEHPEWFEVHNRYIPADEVPRFFGRASLVVLPYLDATQSGIVPMAYQFGLPVVVTRVGSIPEVVDDGITGYLVDPGDEKALAEAIIRILRDEPLCRRMGQAATEKVNRDLSWEKIAEQTKAVYELAKSKR